MNASTAMNTERTAAPPRIWARAALALVVATAVNVALAYAAQAALGVAPQFLALQPGPVISATAIGIVGGTLVFLALRRFTTRSRGAFVVIAAVVAVLSLIAPIALAIDGSGFAGATPAAALALIPLHLVPAAVLIVAVLVPARRRAKVTA